MVRKKSDIADKVTATTNETIATNIENVEIAADTSASENQSIDNFKPTEGEDAVVEGETNTKLANTETLLATRLGDLKLAMINLGIDVANGLINRNRFPSREEVDGINAICKLYETLLSHNI